MRNCTFWRQYTNLSYLCARMHTRHEVLGSLPNYTLMVKTCICHQLFVYHLFYICLVLFSTFSLLSQLYCFGASSVLLPRGTALLVVVVSTVVAVGVRSSFSDDFLLDFFEKKHPILLFFSLATRLNHFSMRNVSSEDTRNVRKKLTYTVVDKIFFFSAFRFPASFRNQSAP